MITQRELTDFRECKQHAEALEKQCKIRRDDLLARRDEPVEPGLLVMKINEFPKRQFSYDAMVDIVGRAQADSLKALLPVTITTTLKVELP